MDMHTGTKLSVTFSLSEPKQVLAALTAGILLQMALANTPERHCIMKKNQKLKNYFPESDLQWNPNGTDRNHRIFGYCIFNAKYNIIYKTVAILLAY
jgi:hypothetical protein